jgi:hypothetical protein
MGVLFEAAAATPSALDLHCLGGAVTSAGPGSSNFGLLLVATPASGAAAAEETSFDLTELWNVVTPPTQRTFDAGLASTWAVRLTNRNKFFDISADFMADFSQMAQPVSPQCDPVCSGVCRDCRTCIGLEHTPGTDDRCAVCFSRKSGLSCLSTEQTMCEKCWPGNSENAPVIFVNPMTGSSLYMDWDKSTVPVPICKKKSDGLIRQWPPAFDANLALITCDLANMKLSWDDSMQGYADNGIHTVTTPAGIPAADWLSSSIWKPITDALVEQLGYSKLTQMRVVSYDWRLGARPS